MVYKIIQYVFWIAIAFFSYLLLLISLQYIPVRFDVAFLVTKTKALQHSYYKIAFFTHVFTAIFTIVLGFPLFSKWVRNKYLNLHKLIGKAYVIIVLGLAAPSGLVMSFFANGGIVSQTSFIFLSLLWLYFTLKAYFFIRQKNIKLHQHFMMRSYALTLSAITLRLLKYIIANSLELPPMDTYIIVAWLSWTLNLLIVEIWIRKNITNGNIF